MLKKQRIFNLIIVFTITLLFGSSRATTDTEDPNKLTESLPATNKLTSIPKNEDLFELINSLKEKLEEYKQNPELDEKTKKLLETIEKILESTKSFIKEKNYDEGVQKFVKHASDISSLIAEEAKEKTGKIKEDLQQFSLLIPKLKNLVVNLISSSELRKVLWATLHSFSDVFSKVSAESSSNLRQVEKSAENLKEDVKKTGKEGAEAAKELKEDLQKTSQKYNPSGNVEDLKKTAKKAVETEGEEGVEDFKNAAKETARQGAQAAYDAAGSVKDGAKRAYDNKADNIKENLQDVKQSAKDLKDDVQTTAQQALQTARQEGKKLFLQRIQPLLKQLTQRRDYQEAASEIHDLFDYFRNLKDNDEVSSISPKLQNELRSLCDEATELLRRFTKGRNIKKIKDSFWKLYNELYLDKETSKYFSDLSSLLRDIVNNPTKYQQFSNVQNTFSDIYDRGTSLVQDKYGESFYELSSQLGQVFQDFSNQKLSSQVRQGVDLASEIVTSSPLHALSQLRKLATPYLRNYTKQITIPSIEGKDQDTYYKVENIIFQVDESKLEDALLRFTVGLKDKIIVELKLTDLDLTFKDVHFHYESKYIVDDGIMDVNVKFPSWFLRWGLEDGDSLFGDSTVEVQLSTLDITIQEADHKLLDKVALSLFSSWIKEKVRSAIESSLREPANNLAQQFNNFVAQNKEFLQNQFIYSDASYSSYLPQFFQTAA